MYRRILLASDYSTEGLMALREGALMAQTLGAEVRLLIVEPAPMSSWSGEEVRRVDPDQTGALLERGLTRLRALGVKASGQIVVGEPAALIGAEARAFEPDLVVVGHRRKSVLERWWSGSSGAYLADHIACSVLIARNDVSDAAFEAAIGGRTG